MNMYIETAGESDVAFIADAILEAIGPDIVSNLAGESNTIDDVRNIFMRLAGRKDTQYSYQNTRLVRNEQGEIMGGCISYDGARLMKLRRSFFEEANRVLKWGMSDEEIDSLPGETSEDEYYLDTLMTLPEYRGMGVATALINDAATKAREMGKPLGLLCDINNERARNLYESQGFRVVGKRLFAGHDMNHLRKEMPV